MPARKKGPETSGNRNVVTIGLSPDANQFLNHWLDRNRGYGKTELLRLIIEKFASWPESMQYAMLGAVPRDMYREYGLKAAEWFEACAKLFREAAENGERFEMVSPGGTDATRAGVVPDVDQSPPNPSRERRPAKGNGAR